MLGVGLLERESECCSDQGDSMYLPCKEGKKENNTHLGNE
jgi:hypothetical protein